MQGVASILDEQHSDKVEALWSELEREFGLNFACVAYPHFTYQVTERYDLAGIESALHEIAKSVAPFKITTSGLGIFTGASPVLYIHMVRQTELSLLHDTVWAAITPFAEGVHGHHYGPPNWIPHVTLAATDLTHDTLPDAVRLLSERRFNWELTIDNIALVVNARGTREDWHRFPLKG